MVRSLAEKLIGCFFTCYQSSTYSSETITLLSVPLTRNRKKSATHRERDKHAGLFRFDMRGSGNAGQMQEDYPEQKHESEQGRCQPGFHLDENADAGQ